MDRQGYNHEHIYQTRKDWESKEHTRRVRRFAGHIALIGIEVHNQMNYDLQEPQFALMSLRLSNMLMPWAHAQDIGTQDNRLKFLQQEELWFRRLAAFQRTKPLGREAGYFADVLEMKLPYIELGQQ